MTDAFIFFTRSSDAAPRILSKFLHGTSASNVEFDFFLCTYDDLSSGGHRELSINGHDIEHWVVGRRDAFSMGYANKVPDDNWVLIPGHCDVPILKFFRENKLYDRYWLVEDDVDYNGDISVLINELATFSEDLICTHVQKGWHDWTYNHTLRCGSSPRPRAEETLLCFLPLFTISRAGLAAVDQAYRDGWSGHHEQVWPTVMKTAGLSIRDIGGDGEFVDPKYRNRFYLGGPGHKANKVGTFVPTPPRLRVGWRKNTLYHPVKPLGQWWFGKRRRYKSILNYYKTRIFG